MFFDYDFRFSWKIPDFSHSDSSIHLNNRGLYVMLTGAFCDGRNRQFIFMTRWNSQ